MATCLTSIKGRRVLLLVLSFISGTMFLDGAQTGCGRTSRDKRIVGGSEDDESSFPWQVRLRSLGATMCGGVLINSLWVLTAASCFQGNYNPLNWNIGLTALGVQDRRIADTEQSGAENQSVHVASFYIYGAYRLGSSRHDLALVRLHSDSVTRQREPVCVIAQDDDVNNRTCLVVGWGSPGVGQPPSPTLRKLLTPVSDGITCGLRHNVSVGRDSLCVELPDGNDGPCTGDSGSPLICEFGDVWKVSGLVSTPFACSNDSTPPALLVNVQYYVPFIWKLIDSTSRSAPGL